MSQIESEKCTKDKSQHESEERKTSHEGSEGRETSHEGIEGRETSHEGTEGRVTSYEGSEGRETSHEGSEGRETSHEGIEGRETSHEGSEGRVTSHEGSEERKTSHEGIEGRETSHEGSEGRVTSHEGSEERKTSHEGIEGRETSHEGIEGRETSHEGIEGRETSHEGTEGRETSHEGIEGRETSHEGIEGRETSHEGTEGRVTSYEGSEGRETSHEGSEGRETSHEGIEGRETSHEGSEGRVTSHEGIEGRETSHEGTEGRVTSYEGSEGRETSHEGSEGRETSREGIEGRETSHEGSEGRVTSHEGSEERKTSHEGIEGRETSHEGSEGRETSHEGSEGRETSHEEHKKEHMNIAESMTGKEGEDKTIKDDENVHVQDSSEHQPHLTSQIEKTTEDIKQGQKHKLAIEEPEVEPKKIKLKGKKKQAVNQITVKGRGAKSKSKMPQYPVFVNDFIEIVLHTLMGGTKDSPIKSNIFDIDTREDLKRCAIVVFDTRVPARNLDTCLENDKQAFLSQNNWANVQFTNPKKLLPMELSAIFAVICNCGNILSVSDGKKSWEVALKKLDLTKKQLTYIFPISENDSSEAEETTSVIKKTQLLMTPSELADKCCPLPDVSFSRFPSALTRHQYNKVSEASPMYGLDVENVSLPTRASVLKGSSGQDSDIEYDAVIQNDFGNRPLHEYTDRFSDLTETNRGREVLANVKESAEVARNELCLKLPSDVILVAHSAASDLKAMGMIHPYIIDPSLLYTLPGFKGIQSLKKLSLEYLNLVIQEEKHNPIVDACAALKLVELKLQHDVAFGNDRFKNSIKDIIPPASAEEGKGLIISHENDVKKYWDEIQSHVQEAGGDMDTAHKNVDFQQISSIEEGLHHTVNSLNKHQLTLTILNTEENDTIDNYQMVNSVSKTIFDNLGKNSLFIAFIVNEQDDKGLALMTVKP